MAGLTFRNVYKQYGRTKVQQIFDADKSVTLDRDRRDVDATVRRVASSTAAPYAVDNFSLECPNGTFVGILGPSGCGKTTSLRMVAGLEEITRGDILIGDRVVNNLHPKDRDIGLAFEDYALYPPLNVFDNIAFNLRAKKMPEDEVRRRVLELAPLMKVEDLLDAKPAGLSGGQKQRVNIARALVRQPSVLLLDEPLSHLDGKMRQILRTEIKRIHNRIKCTTVLVTHDQLEAMSLSDRIAIMKDGRLQQFGTPLEVYDNPVNVFVAGFIGEPPMNLARVGIVDDGRDRFFLFPAKGIRIRVPGKYAASVFAGDEVILGVRPTDVLINPDDPKAAAVPIAVFENLGDEKRISIEVGPEEYLTLVTEDEKRYRPGDEIKLVFRETKTHIFDKITGDRILGKE
ncbi:MAG: ABC transporter ATP-binding protein [Planctomycetota bacterium]|jgi:multiple sugar transport system ATP-binding protein|nr:ABC transporter ATP-binding protein [Planctomycetota bacterium]